MKSAFFCFTILVAFNSYSQSFSVQQNNVSLNGLSSNFDFSQNTYLDAFADDSLTWNIIMDSLPPSWSFSYCFPICYSIGVTYGDLVISNGQSYYLNCHIYPNNTSGEGFITMEINNNSGYSEEVKWYGVAGNVGIVNQFLEKRGEVKNIYNLNGQIVNDYKPNQIYIVQLNDNSLVKIFVNGE